MKQEEQMASIRKRTWTARGVTQTAWIVDYFDQAGKRHVKTFTAKKEAEQWRVGALHEVQQGTHTPASTSITMAEVFTRWVDHCKAEGLEYGTIVQRRQHLKLHIQPFIGGEKLASLTMPRIYQLDTQLRKAGRSLAMRRKVLTNVKTALTFAQSQGLVAQNVARSVRIKSEDRRGAGRLKEGADFPTKAEIKLLIDKAPPRQRPFIITAVFTGMRASELRGLSWKDVDLDAGIIHVRQRADAWRHIGSPKSAAGSREIPLVPMAVNALRQWRAGCPPGELGLVFPNGAGRVESQSNILGRFWGPLQVACGITDGDGQGRYTFHSLRHTAASLFIAHLGWTAKRVQVVLGHSSISMTFDRYGHLFADPAGDREAMKRLEAAVAAA
jgi:integrase